MEQRLKKHSCLRRVLTALLLLILGTLFFFWQQEDLVTEVYRVQASGLPDAFDGLRIVQLSDLHGKQFGPESQRLLEAVADLEPDLIAVTGDLIDRSEQLSMVPALARGLAAIAPTFYVTGNHEWAVRRVVELKGLLADCGVTVLSGDYTLLKREGAILAVAGIDDPNGPGGLAAGRALKQRIQKEQGEIYTLLLSHRDMVDTYAQWGYELTLCGHGHGGIWRIPVLNQGLFSTSGTWFPRYDGGAYELEGGGVCVVSRGLGNNTTPLYTFRLFNRPDLPLIILNTSEEIS